MDSTLLLKHTLDLIEKESIFDLESLERVSRDRNSFWFKLAIKYFGQQATYSDALNIFSRWKRDTSNLRTHVSTHLEAAITIDLFIKLDEWLDIQKYTSTYDGRKKFLSKFDIYISEKLQEQFNLKCAFKCKNNWFFKFQNKGRFWQGEYKCIGKNCEIKFKAFIKKFNPNDDSVRIKVQFNQPYNNPNHTTLSIKSRCAGKDRIEQGKNIALKGLLISQSDNICYNQGVDSLLSKLKLFKNIIYLRRVSSLIILKKRGLKITMF
jgi:hypothetical protein